jgi:hypothetical protein
MGMWLSRCLSKTVYDQINCNISAKPAFLGGLTTAGRVIVARKGSSAKMGTSKRMTICEPNRNVSTPDCGPVGVT